MLTRGHCRPIKSRLRRRQPIRDSAWIINSKTSLSVMNLAIRWLQRQIWDCKMANLDKQIEFQIKARKYIHGRWMWLSANQTSSQVYQIKFLLRESDPNLKLGFKKHFEIIMKKTNVQDYRCCTNDASKSSVPERGQTSLTERISIQSRTSFLAVKLGID